MNTEILESQLNLITRLDERVELTQKAEIFSNTFLSYSDEATAIKKSTILN
jgi:hypothetical protein